MFFEILKNIYIYLHIPPHLGKIISIKDILQATKVGEVYFKIMQDGKFDCFQLQWK